MRSTTVLHFLGWILLIWSRCSFEVLAKYQSKQTGSRGDRLLIGSLYPVRSFYDVMPTIAFFGIRCTPGGNQENFTLGIYKIRDKYYEDDYGMEESEIRVTKEVKLSDYFLTVYRRAWLCKPAGRPDLTDEFVSINTVIISIKDIYNIRYEEGVDVYLQKFDVDRVKVVERLCVAKDVVNNTYSFPFKCLDDWRYEQETEEISHIPDLAVEILKNPPRPVDDELQEDVPVQENSTSISDNGPSIRIEPSPSTIDKPNKKYVCQNSFVNTELFLPKCYQKFDGHYALIPQEEFGKRFMIIDREVQICESGENDRIFRISHTVIGRTNISNIEYGNGITELYAIKLPDGGRSIRYTEVRNFYAKTRKPVMDYNVQYTFSFIKRFKSLIAVSTDGTIEPIDIDYKLPPGSIFRVLISPEGYNIRVGSRPVADINAKDVECRRLMFNNHQIQYGINIEIITVDQNGLRHSLVHDTELIHIDKWDQIVLSCASENYKSVNFLRVMNFITITDAPIHYIETYDGVEFIRFKERNGNDILQIIEVKYILIDGMAVRFVGTLMAEGDIMSSYQLGYVPHILKKGEIYPLPNTDVPTREHISRDYQWNGEQYEHFKNEKDQEKTMRLEVNGESNLAANQSEVIICKAEETLVERFPFFKIMKETTEIESMSSDTDRTFNEKYFDNMKSEKWLCREILRENGASITSSPTEIDRVITKQTLKRPNDISVIEHTPLDRLWFEMYNNEYQTKMEGIRYYQKEGEKFKLYNNLNSYVIFEHDSSTGAGQWKSGTKQLDNFNGKSKKMFETLRYDESNYNPKMMYHLDVSRSQHAERTLLMGSKWTKIYGNSRTNLICVEEEELARREFLNNNTLYLTKVSEQGSGNNKNKFHVDFNLLTLKIWNCTDKDNSKLSLYGVMNTFTIKQLYDYNYNDYNRVTLKEIKFYDGVTVLHGKVPGQIDMEDYYEFTEFKYLDVADMSSVKFEGSIEMASGSGLAQVSTTLINMAAKDTAYVLNQAVPGRNEVFRTKINNKGVTLQIGERLPPDPNARSSLDLHCHNPRDRDQPVALIKSIGFPRILKLNSTHHPVLMTLNELPHWFDLTQEVQWCETVTDDSERTSSIYYRIVTVLKWKNRRSKIRQIYHYDEVSIRDSDNQLTIEEVKYILCESETQKDESTKRTYRKVRLDRFVTFPEANGNEQFMKRHMYHREKINYRLDKELWKLSNAEETGVTIQVQSHFDRTINIDYSSSFITCLKIEDNPVANPKFNSKICSNMGSEVEEMKYVDVSEFPALKQVSQEVWRCTGAEDFIIVQNKMISTDSRMRVYHRPPATVGTLFLPNGEKSLLISDQRFLKGEQRGDGEYEYKVIKVLGSMNLVLETLPEADTFLRRTIGVPVRILAKRTHYHVWTLDSLRLLAFRDLQLAEHSILAVNYTGDINQQHFHTKILDSGASRMFQLGRFYDKVLSAEDLHERKPLECIQFPWDSEFTSKYIPTVTEYVGRHSYTMDKQTFYENFQVINVAVWLCTNKFNELLRVRTVYQPKQKMPIFAVRYTDGIEVEVSRGGKRLIRVNEILYMDVLALDVYRYDGDLEERILPPITPVTESDSKSKTENYEEDLIIENKQPKNLCSNVAAKRGTCLKSVNTIIGLFRCLTPYFRRPKRGNSKKPPQSPPGKPKA